MAKRLVETVLEGTSKVKIYYHSDVSEYQCRLYLLGVLAPAHDYFTDDKQDALDTASAMLAPYK